MTLTAILPISSAVEQGRMIRDRTLSPVDLMQAYLDRIDSYDAVLRAYITVCAEPALAAARKAEREIATGNWRSAARDSVRSQGPDLHARCAHDAGLEDLRR